MRWAVVAIALLWCNSAHAETRVYLLRGWFGVFSTGMDSMAEELRGKGIKAEAIGHVSWKSTVSKVVKERAAGKTGRLVLVGHSQGANNVIEMARELETHKVPVDLLITLAPFLQDPIPSNVVRALNYYQSPGWGTPLTADLGFKGELSNIGLSDVTTVEGLASGPDLHPLQTAFAEEGAAQCGYCTPGMLLSAKALLDAHPRPTREQMAEAISGNLCRCTGYTSIYEAIERASRA